MVTAKHGNALNDIELLAGFTAAQSGSLDAASPPRAGIEGRFAGRGSLKAGRVACPAPHDLGFWLGEVDHRGRLGAAVARVDHRVHSVIELVRAAPARSRSGRVACPAPHDLGF